jgi:hypothetical protein
MWRCSSCGTLIDEAFDACWNCGAAQDGTANADFHAEPNDSAVPDLGPDPEPPTESAAEIEAARVMHERIVELCSAANIVEADGICELLDEAGIQARVVGDDLGTAAGCLPLGEATTPRIWVRESDADHARQVIQQWQEQQENGPIELPDNDDWLEGESPVEADETALPSDVRFHFLNQGFFLAGFVCIIVGAVWAWQNSLTLSKYSAVADGRYVSSDLGDFKMVSVPDDRNLPLQPFIKTRFSYEFSKNVRYAYVVAGKTCDAYMEVDEGQEPPDQVPIHYDPHDPAEHVVGSIAPPWVVMLFAGGIAAFLSFVGYQFR